VRLHSKALSAVGGDASGADGAVGDAADAGLRHGSQN